MVTSADHLHTRAPLENPRSRIIGSLFWDLKDMGVCDPVLMEAARKRDMPAKINEHRDQGSRQAAAACNDLADRKRFDRYSRGGFSPDVPGNRIFTNLEYLETTADLPHEVTGAVRQNSRAVMMA